MFFISDLNIVITVPEATSLLCDWALEFIEIADDRLKKLNKIVNFAHEFKGMSPGFVLSLFVS